jgi:hypothetical protein
VSSSSSTSSKKRIAAADAAALRVKLESLREENKKQRELEDMESKLLRMKRQLDEERLESELNAEQARLKVLEQDDDEIDRDVLSLQTVDCVGENESHNDRKSDVHAWLNQCDFAGSRVNVHAQQFVPRKQNTVDCKQNTGECRCTSETSKQSSISSGSSTHEQLVDALAKAITASRLPVLEPSVFTGDPMMYSDWLFSFTSLIENRGIPASERIHYLKRYLGGPAKEAVSGYFMLRSKDAYQCAGDVLEKRFGDAFTVSEAFRSKLDAWPKVSSKDSQGLRSLSDFLMQCTAAAQEIDLKILDDVREIRKISLKLPDFIVHRWNRQTALCKREKKRYPTFREFSMFVYEEAETANDSVTSFQPPAVQATTNRQGQRPPEHAKSVFYTNQEEIHFLSVLQEEQSQH